MKNRELVFASKEMELAIRTARAVAAAASPVLIEGESGTGKELIARLIHRSSARSDKPFVAVNCGALPEGLFESELFGHVAGSFTGAIRDKRGILEIADGGVLFLDEIGDLALASQAKLLRVLQESEFRRVGDTRTTGLDVRVISATNKDLEEEMRRKRFREDLFFRIGVLRITVEPLRRRRADIAPLADHFAAKHATAQGRPPPSVAPAVLALFESYAWPGNVRELENEIQRLIAFSPDGAMDARYVSRRIREWAWGGDQGRPGGSLRDRVALFERRIICETLERYSWNKTETARHLGLTRQGLHRKVRKLGILRDGVETAAEPAGQRD
jgi:two-component system response regulator HupR/HoxA